MKPLWMKNRRQNPQRPAPASQAQCPAGTEGQHQALPTSDLPVLDGTAFYRYLAIPTFIRRGINIKVGL